MRIHRTFYFYLAIATFVSAPLAAQSNHEVAALVASPRRAADAPPPGPPDLSAEAGRIAPLTLEEGIESPGTSRRTVCRTADRIHIAFDDGREWLFVRNPADSRRAVGYLVEHGQKKISTYGESDLRNAVGIRGWADVLSLGFDPSVLDGLAPTKDERTIGDVRFVKYAGGAGEVWWSAEHLLAVEVDLHDAVGPTTRLTIESIRAGVDESLLQVPMKRFPDYREASYVDWLEDH